MNYSSFIGIDVSKLTFDAFIHHRNNSSVFRNQLSGFAELCSWARNITLKDPGDIFFCFEHTGLYSLNLAIYLQQAGIPFAMVPALDIKRSLGTTRGKNDQIDAKRIAEYAYLRREDIKATVMPSATIMKLQPLLTLRDNLVADRANYSGTCKEQKLFLDKDLHAELFAVYGQLIVDLGARIRDIETRIRAAIDGDEQISRNFELVTTVKGIGPLTACYLIVCTNNFTKFGTWRKFACYSGIAPFEHQSGTSIRGRAKVSHLANKHIKTLLFLCANSAVQNDSQLRAYYQRRVQEGKSKMSTLNIIKNKLIARVFAVVKRETAYVDTMKFAS